MPTSILNIPPEVLQKIVLYTTLGSRSEVGPPMELYSCLLTCRRFTVSLSPKNASELYFLLFAQKFDIQSPIYRLGTSLVRENVPYEMRRRFQALQIFKNSDLYHADLTEALWIAYLMVEDADTSQKNIRQLLRANLPIFLSQYLRQRLYDGAEKNNDWPLMTVQNSLALALSWTLASKNVLNYEEREVCEDIMRLLKPLVFATFRYSIFHTPEDLFTYSSALPLLSSNVSSAFSDVSPFSPSPYSSSSSSSSSFSPISPTSPSSMFSRDQHPPSLFPPEDISYFGTVKRKARPPSAAIFAILLYFARVEVLTTYTIPPHITCQTREEADRLGLIGPCVDDIREFHEQCRTRFADFPGIDVGIHSSTIPTSPSTILCQPSLYELGRLSGQWRGSHMYPNHALYSGTLPDCGVRKALHISLQEHFCHEESSSVPLDEPESGTNNAWLPPDIQAVETESGMQFFDGKGSFNTTYETYRHGTNRLRDSRRIADIIITGKTEDRYIAAWDGPSKIIGRVRLHDGLMVLVRYSALGDTSQRQVLRGYVTSSQNLVGRLLYHRVPSDANIYFEGVFSLGKDYTHVTSRSNPKTN